MLVAQYEQALSAEILNEDLEAYKKCLAAVLWRSRRRQWLSRAPRLKVLGSCSTHAFYPSEVGELVPDLPGKDDTLICPSAVFVQDKHAFEFHEFLQM